MFEEILDNVKKGRPLSTETTAGKIRTYLESLPEGTKVDVKEVAKRFNYDESATSKIIRGTRTPASKSFELLSPTDKKINRINNFIKDFRKQNKRLPTQGEIVSGAKTDTTELRKLIDQGSVKNVQKTVFDKQRIGIDYILNTEKPTLKGLQKKLKGTGQNANNLLANLYKRSLVAIGDRVNKVETPRSVFKDYSVNELSQLKDKIRDVPDFSSYYERDIRDLVSDAYKNKPKQYKKAMSRINEYFKLNKEIKTKFPNLGLQLDHPISYKFLTDIKKETNPENLIRVRPIPERVNTFKVGLDNRLREIATGLQKQPGSKKLLNEYSALQKLGKDIGFDIGKISKAGKFLSYQAPKIGDASLLPDIRKSVDIQNKFTNLIRLYSKGDPTVRKLFKDAGININALANVAKTGKINPKTFSKFIDAYVAQNPKAKKLLATQGLGPLFIAELPLYTMAEGKPFVETLDPLTFGAVNPVTYAAKKQADLSTGEKLAMQRQRNLDLLRNRIGDTTRQEMLGSKDPEYRALGPGKPSYLDFLIQKMEQPDYAGSLTSGQQKIEDKAQELRQKVMTPEKTEAAKTRYESFQKAFPIVPLVTNFLESMITGEKVNPYQKTLEQIQGPTYQENQIYKKGGIVALDEYKELRKKYGP